MATVEKMPESNGMKSSRKIEKIEANIGEKEKGMSVIVPSFEKQNEEELAEIASIYNTRILGNK